ncbi:cyclase family protein [Rhodococcus tibetensis]|uniref:Cyclase family protein n=1 Tax=Rhodococcus tibetensis TaxID=2965064 RepID=A0ABT1QG58_9NOCA|nr:cyclase family protein [Rhodococcus sp. FXJ9.536]MCQ4121241.1 cyclase family protein [Rhodococcus sp. FXJ9.536]
MPYVRRIVDLSHTIGPGMPVYPGDPVPTLTRHCTIERDGYNVLDVRFGSQSGTHVDAPAHMDATGATVDTLAPELFVGRGVVFDVRDLGARQGITADMIRAEAARVHPGDIALFHTGWSRHYGHEAYYTHPFLDPSACELLLEQGVRTFCLDAPSIDETPAGGHTDTGYPVHHLIAGAGGVIGENLCHLDRIDFPDPLVSLLPINIEGSDGAPTRAVALDVHASAR